MPPPRIPFRVFAIAFGALTVFAAAVSWGFSVRTGTSLWSLQADATVNPWYVVAMNVVYWGSWAVLAPLALALARRWRIDAASWPRTLPVHLMAGFGVGLLHVLIVATFRTLALRVVGIPAEWGDRVVEMFLRTMDWEFCLYGALVGLQHSVDYYAELRERETRAAQLETRLVEAQLQALQRQLHPHFLFNTLHAISALVHRDPDKADEMIERLSDLLRVTLDNVGVQEVPLAQELEYLRAYLDIEQVHFGERLQIEYRVDMHALDALVPSLIFQPIVENAIRHGLEPRVQRGVLSIEASRDGDRLRLRVEDNGRGLSPVAVHGRQGVGLTNTRSRLERLYGAAATLTLEPAPGGGVIVTALIPLRRAPQEPLANAS